ncbi:MAG TPA: thiosulfate oxidation carrier protein SoxY [Devosia sp.]|nr:thiosulfate oxidation carrier protein SoxY [Devosia sp.]
MADLILSRRDALAGLGATMLLLTAVPLPGFAADADTAEAIKQQFGDRVAQDGKVTLKLPALAETGNSVPITCSVDSPMTDADRVVRVAIFANRNPRPLIANMLFGPKAGQAMFSTNMRLSGTQDVIAIAEMADKSLWKTQTRVKVTVGACDTLQSRY